MKTRTILLVSSNSTREYTLDILESVALPRGMVHHFRYALKLVSPQIFDLFHGGAESSNGLGVSEGRVEVLVSYVYQNDLTDSTSPQNWRAVYPIRMGELVHAETSGDNPDVDVAHFYFKVSDFIDPDKTKLFDEDIRQSDSDRYYVREIRTTPFEARVPEERSVSAFHSITKRMEAGSFAPPQGLPYVPFFCYVAGISTATKALTPEYDDKTRVCHYVLKSGKQYKFRFSTYLGDLSSEIRTSLVTEESVFSNPSHYELVAACQHDEESWVLVPSEVATSRWTILKLETEFAKVGAGFQPLPLRLALPVLVKRNWAVGFAELAADLFFAAAMAILNVTVKELPTWASNVIWGCLGAWVLARLAKFKFKGT